MSIWKKLIKGLSFSSSGDVFADRLDALSLQETWAFRPRTRVFRNRAAHRAA